MTLQLQTTIREGKTDLGTLRAEGKLPAVYYGGGKENTLITLDYSEFLKMYKEAGESTMIDLVTEKGSEQVLVQEVQTDPVKGHILHVDFKVVESGKPIEVTVPLAFEGESLAVKQGLGSLTKTTQEIVLEVLPKDLPSEIAVDLGLLATADDQILAKDLKLPAGSLITDAETVIAVITAAREESDEETSGEIDFSAIAVEKKGKEVPAEESVE